MAKINKDIKNQFAAFTSLLSDRKNTIVTHLYLNGTKKSRPDTYYEQSPLRYHDPDHKVDLIVECRKDLAKSFKFQLACNTLTAEPYFRFDSDGATHKVKGLPLNEQMITTPHFNTFDENGKSIAYKTTQLKDELESKALEDINLSFIHFCHEANIRYPIDDFTEIIPNSFDQLTLKVENEDILNNIHFND